MKKILLASTALVLSTGFAQAQGLSIGGEGRMGIIHTRAGGVSTTVQENRLQMNFAVSVQADHGLSFGAFSRVRINNGTTGVFSGSRVWVESNGFRLTFGNQDGAIRGVGASHGYLGGCGVGYVGGHLCGDSAGLLGVTHGFDSTGGGPAARARVDYTMGDYAVALSHDRGGATELAARARFDAFTVAAGYARNTGAGRVVTVSGHYNGGNWGAGVILARIGATTNGSISANVELGGGNLYGYVGRVGGESTYGLNYGYGLGGGATITAGAERVGATTVASIGVAFRF
ncbi:MAG: porin [Pararhodobacter sp.]